MNENIYKPNGCKTLAESTNQQIRCGIQGPPFSGKTYSALTFPNPVIASLDRKTSAHTHRDDAYDVPFWDGAFCDSLVKRNGLATPPNRCFALLKWITTEGLKLTTSQTLIIDNSTGLEEAVRTQYWLAPVVTKSGEIDSFGEWNHKIDFFADFHTALKELKCDVVYITHEQDERDKKGELTGGIRPLMTGQVGDKLAGNYTDWFAAMSVPKPTDNEQREKLKKWAGIDETTLNEWINSTPNTYRAIHLWQTQPDNIRRSLGTTSLQGCPKYVLANYSSFNKYKRVK